MLRIKTLEVPERGAEYRWVAVLAGIAYGFMELNAPWGLGALLREGREVHSLNLDQDDQPPVPLPPTGGGGKIPFR